MQILDRRWQVVEDLRRIDNMIGAARSGARLVVREFLARLDEAQLRQTEIRHGPRHHADILRQLRFDQNDRRAFGNQGALSVCTGHF
jgi:hypothetical protein